MGRPPQLKRIAKEEFKSEDQELVGKIAFPINSFHEEVRNLFNNNIDFTNLNQELVTITAIVDADGVPTPDIRYKSKLNTRVQGMVCIRAINETTSTNFPTSTPFAIFSQSTNIVTVANITGLTANDRYQLTFLTIG